MNWTQAKQDYNAIMSGKIVIQSAKALRDVLLYAKIKGAEQAIKEQS